MRTASYNGNRNEEMRMGNSLSTADEVLGYLHSIPITLTVKKTVYQQLQAEIYDEHLNSLKKKLSDIALLEEDWDGYEAERINPLTIRNFKKVLATCKATDFAEWSLSPNTNGTLLLERDEAAISIASKDYSCYAEQGNRYMEDNHHEFTVASLLDTVRRINAFLIS